MFPRIVKYFVRQITSEADQST
uniref:Uncharacterized protein n=1 Tax=Anguilla anguilla TaxID=7936 RepID=A0A0E9QAE4_ANGAN